MRSESIAQLSEAKARPRESVGGLDAFVVIVLKPDRPVGALNRPQEPFIACMKTSAIEAHLRMQRSDRVQEG